MPEEWRPVETITQTLALAVELTDGVVGGRPVGDPEIRVAGVDEAPVRNRSGYYLFFGLPAETVTVTVDGGDHYADATASVDLDPDSPTAHDTGEAVEVSLAPTPSYPFPTGLTRVRGTVWDGDVPVADADVSVDGFARTTRTTDTGEFAYYFDDVDRDDVETDAATGERRYRPGGDDPTFEVDGTPGTTSQSVRVIVGRLTTQDLHY